MDRLVGPLVQYPNPIQGLSYGCLLAGVQNAEIFTLVGPPPLFISVGVHCNCTVLLRHAFLTITALSPSARMFTQPASRRAPSWSGGRGHRSIPVRHPSTIYAAADTKFPTRACGAVQAR